MKAVIYTEYGPPENLQVQEVPIPSPAEGEVLIKLEAVSLNRSDWESLIGKPAYARIGGLRKPRRHILGSDIAGRVEAVGANVTRLKPGDEIFADILWHLGGFAEYVCVRERALALKPDGLSFEQASTIPQAGVIALQGLRDARQVSPGQHILINGAGGGTGMFAIQLAKMYGAEVTAVDNSEKLDFMRSMGADHVLDYTREDFTKQKQKYDMVLDLVAYRTAFAYNRALKPGGKYYLVGGSLLTMFQVLLLGPVIGAPRRKKIRILVARPNHKDMLDFTALCEQGKIVPVIDRRFPLEEVPDALRYLGEGHAKGKVVISMK